MVLCNIQLNAISITNLMIAIGISIEFCAHMTHAFTVCFLHLASTPFLHALIPALSFFIHNGLSCSDCEASIVIFVT